MYVFATAGHVDHGKSALVEALTGTHPDRLAEERRRGLTIELGHCATTLPRVGDVAFVDVPGHERFVPTMLAGVGPVPAVLFVVAADDPWMPQAAEHLAALDALGVRHGVLVVTRCDLADPEPVAARAAAELAGTSLAGLPVVCVSARTGRGVAELATTLAEVTRTLPPPVLDTDVRLWVDRSFTRPGAGTVVTGTLAAGAIHVGDRLACGEQSVRVRGLHSLGRAAEQVCAVARVAVAVGSSPPSALHRGSALVTVGAWHSTKVADVRHDGPPLPERPVLHLGTAAVGCRVRPLGGGAVRLLLEQPLPLRTGDRLLLRDPGSRSLQGVSVLDPDPPALSRRGAAAARARALADSPAAPDLADELRRRGVVRRSVLRRLGVPTLDADRLCVGSGDWLVDRRLVPDLQERLRRLVADYATTSPLDPGPPAGAVARALDLPDESLLAPLLPAELQLRAGRVTGRQQATLPEEVEEALRRLAAELAGRPFAAPAHDRLLALGLDAAAVGAARRAGRLLVLAEGVVLLPGADGQAVTRLAALPQPFTVSEARVALASSRRVVLPLLALLDRSGRTRRLPDDRRMALG
ncbi:MAG: SelB C-terminal domain-containing protein [Nocardioidaceae bacterium]